MKELLVNEAEELDKELMNYNYVLNYDFFNIVPVLYIEVATMKPYRTEEGKIEFSKVPGYLSLRVSLASGDEDFDKELELKLLD